MPVDAAVAEARKAISLSASNSVEWGTPVLHMRSPDGALFRIDGMTTSRARASGMYHAAPAELPDTPPPAASPVVPPPAAAPAPAPAAAPPAALVSAPAPAGGLRSRWPWFAAAGAGVILLAFLLPGIIRRFGTPPATWASTHAKVQDVSVEPVSEGLWNLILAVDYRPSTVRGEAEVACTLRQGEKEQRDVEVSVVLSPDFSGGEFNENFRIRDPWPAAQYPVSCTVDGESVFEGDIDWQP
jgi:hypothetical protein